MVVSDDDCLVHYTNLRIDVCELKFLMILTLMCYSSRTQTFSTQKVADSVRSKHEVADLLACP
jgi:hypothetical protein